MKKIVKKIYSGILIALVFAFLSLPASLLVAQTSSLPPSNSYLEVVNPQNNTDIYEPQNLTAKIYNVAYEEAYADGSRCVFEVRRKSDEVLVDTLPAGQCSYVSANNYFMCSTLLTNGFYPYNYPMDTYNIIGKFTISSVNIPESAIEVGVIGGEIIFPYETYGILSLSGTKTFKAYTYLSIVDIAFKFVIEKETGEMVYTSPNSTSEGTPGREWFEYIDTTLYPDGNYRVKGIFDYQGRTYETLAVNFAIQNGTSYPEPVSAPPVELSVDLISPHTTPATVNTGDSLFLSAAVNRPEAEIASVDFVFLKSGESSPIRVTASPVMDPSLGQIFWNADQVFNTGQEGEYTLTVDVALREGTLHTSIPEYIFVEKPLTDPVIEVLSPQTGNEVFLETDNLPLAVVIDKTASDITFFKFLIKDELGAVIFDMIGSGIDDSAGNSNWEKPFDLLGYNGNYMFDVEVGYNGNIYNLPAAVNFTVQSAEQALPEVRAVINEPTGGLTYDPGTVKELTATVNRVEGVISDFYFILKKGGSPYKEMLVENPDFSGLDASFWKWQVDPAAPLAEGTYTLVARFKYAGNGLEHFSDTVNFTVQKEESAPISEQTDPTQTTESNPVPLPPVEYPEAEETTYTEQTDPTQTTESNPVPLPPVEDTGTEETEEIIPDVVGDLLQVNPEEKIIGDINSGEIIILDQDSINFADKNFTAEVKAGASIERVGYVLENERSGESRIFPAFRGVIDGHWFKLIDLDSEADTGKYKFFAKGYLPDGSFVKSNELFFEISPQSFMEDDLFKDYTLPLSCTDKGYDTAELCDRYLALNPLCRDKGLGIKDIDECKRMLFVEMLPIVCREIKSLDENDCIEKLEITYNCFIRGIFSKSACSDYENSFTEFVTKDENIKEIIISEEVKERESAEIEINQNQLNDICIYHKIITVEECDEFLKMREISEECASKGIRKTEECKKYLDNKYIVPECKEKGLIRERECKEYIFKKYSPLVVCEGIDGWQCKNKIKEDYLAEVVAVEKLSHNIETKIIDKIEYIDKIEDLKADLEFIAKEDGSIPLKDEAVAIKIIKAKKDTVLTKDEDLIQTLPIAIVLDDDNDGLSNDMEKELGTDPSKPDTDGDGYLDGEEIANGYSPLLNSVSREEEIKEIESTKLLLESVSPLNKAIIAGNSIEHPRLSGEEVSQLAVETIKNSENNEEGYNIAGRGIPGEYITLYIYSDLPVVVTTKVDENGNWSYDLKKSLADGEHEVYVVINDDTGKITSKSSPLNFFVKEAKAVSIEEVIGNFAETEKATEESKLISIYFLFVGAVVFIGILTFIVFINHRKEGDDLG